MVELVFRVGTSVIFTIALPRRSGQSMNVLPTADGTTLSP